MKNKTIKYCIATLAFCLCSSLAYAEASVNVDADNNIKVDKPTIPSAVIKSSTQNLKEKEELPDDFVKKPKVISPTVKGSDYKEVIGFYNKRHLDFLNVNKENKLDSLIYKKLLHIAKYGQIIKLSIGSDSAAISNENSGDKVNYVFLKGLFNSIANVDNLKSYKKEIRLIHQDINTLRNKISINKSYGNSLAVQRDEILTKYYSVLSSFLEYTLLTNNLINKNTDVDINSITEAKLKWLSNIEEGVLLLRPAVGSGKISKTFNHNLHDLYSSIYMFKSTLNFISTNQDYIKKASGINLLSLNSWIGYINDNSFSSSLNKKLNVISVDVGGIVMFVVLFLTVIVAYPFLFKLTRDILGKYVIKGLSENKTIDNGSEFAYIELRKPIKILMVFFGIDLSTKALLYKTDLINSLEQFSFVIYVAILSWIFIKVINTIVSFQVDRIKKKDFLMRKELFNLIIYIIKSITFIVATTIILTHFGISIAAILSTLGIGGLAFALAAKDTLSNLFGGVSIMLDNVFSLDDWVKIGDSEGTVASIGLRSTTLRTFDNALITIPNAQISTTDVLNWNKRRVGRRIKMYLGVTYESGMGNIKNAVEDIRIMLKEHKDISNPLEKSSGMSTRRQTHFYNEATIDGIKSTQLVFVDKFNDSSVDILVYCFSKTVNWEQWLTTKEDVLYNIASIMAKNNVEFAYPTETHFNKIAS